MSLGLWGIFLVTPSDTSTTNKKHTNKTNKTNTKIGCQQTIGFVFLFWLGLGVDPSTPAAFSIILLLVLHWSPESEQMWQICKVIANP